MKEVPACEECDTSQNARFAVVVGLIGLRASVLRRYLEAGIVNEERFASELAVVMARATQLWPLETAVMWMTGYEPFLDGARPIDVLRTRGPQELLDALDAVAAGVYS